MCIAAAALAGVEVVLEVRVTGGDKLHRLDCAARERRAPKVRVEDDARRVDHAPLAWPPKALELGDGVRGELLRARNRAFTIGDRSSAPLDLRSGD